MSGLYVASNVTALGAQVNLQRNTSQLQEIITRLSTGLKINSGKDDPSGLIASELLKSDMTATKQAIQNTQRAIGIIAIADSALGQITSLLNDIRGLVNASANTGAMTAEQLQANQLQVDASLDSIDRIAKTTNYQGQLLLDGSFDFTTSGVDRNQVEELQVNSANFGTEPAVDIEIDVIAAAETAKMYYSFSALAEDTVIEIGGNMGRNIFSFTAGASVASMAKAINALSDSTGVIAKVGSEATHGQILLTSAGSNNDVNLTALTAGSAAGNYSIKFTAGNSTQTNVVIAEPTDGKTGVIDFQLQMQPWSPAAATVDESMIGIHANEFTFQDNGAGNINDSIIIKTDTGLEVKTLNLIPADNGNKNPELTGPVAIDLDRDGVMNIEYHATKTDAAGNAVPTTLQDVVDAINKAYPELLASIGGNNIDVVDWDQRAGKIYGEDLRTSNAITITANQYGEGLNNTDIIYVNNSLQADVPGAVRNQKASTTISLDGTAANTLTIEANNEGQAYNGYTFNFVNGIGGAVTATLGGGNIVTIDSGAVDFTAVTAVAINQALAAANIEFTVSGNVVDIEDTTTLITGTHNGTNPTAPAMANDVISGKFGATDAVMLTLDANNEVTGSAIVPPNTFGTNPENTVNTAQAASTTISLDGSDVNTMTVTAKDVGSQNNGITFMFANDTSPTPSGRVTATQSGNIITINSGAADFTAITAEMITNALSAAGLKYTIDFSVPAAVATITGTTQVTLGTHQGLTANPPAPSSANDIISGTIGLGASQVPTNLVLDSENKVVAIQSVVSYNQLAQKATTTVFDGTNYLKFQAGAATSLYNGTDIKIENDSDVYKNGKVVASYNEEQQVLHIVGDLANATYTDLMGAVKDATGGAITVSVSANPEGTITIATGGTKMTTLAAGSTGSGFSFKLGDRNTSANIIGIGTNVHVVGGTIGTDHGAIIYNAIGGVTTAQDVVDTINADSIVGKLVTAARFSDSSGVGLIFREDDTQETIRYFSSIMQGGFSGGNTVVTADDLVDFINSHDVLKEMFHAELASGNNGYGLLTLFEEVAYYNADEQGMIAGSALQFLGPKGSPNIEFIAGPGYGNQELGIAFVNDPANRAEAALTAENANAAFSIIAATTGADYEDVAVQFVRLDGTYTSADNYATYESGPSAAIAYCSINPTDSGTSNEIGNFILTATSKGDTYNNVEIMFQLNDNQSEQAVATFDSDLKRLVISVNDKSVTLDQALAAIEKEGTFTADFDYSYNANPNSDPGMCDFTKLFESLPQRIPTSVGNTGNTGGHKGGVITVYLGGADEEITAQAAIDAINNSVQTKNLFSASNYSGSDGSGRIDIRNDTIMNQSAECGTVPDFKMITRIISSDCETDNVPTMLVYLATDQDGNSITTAKDLVDFFETLTAEATRGISVSLLQPPGYPNVVECPEDPAPGSGILQPTGYYDECDNWLSDPIEFVTANTYYEETFAQGRVVAVNGSSASYDIIAKNSGEDYNGVSLQYQAILDSAGEPSVVYDALTKTITVNIKEGFTTAAEVKELIESSAETRALFTVSLADGTGTGLVTLSDDSVHLSGGLQRIGTPGGASMMGAYDADPNKLILESIEEGSAQYVSVRVISGTFDVRDENGKAAETTFGKDMQAKLNGIDMQANGRVLSNHTSMMDLNITLSSSVQAGDTVSFQITGGGATFQMGPDVVSSQQIRIGIPSVNTTRLGGLSGKLYELRSGERADLSNVESAKIADRIVQEAILSVTTLRGRLGALQRCTLEPNMAALEDTYEQIAAAEADISNADFAEESSRLTRAQILVQSGAQVLGLANQLPQYAASLIGG